MSDAVETPKAGWRMKVALSALGLSIFTGFWFALAALGTNWGWWSYGFSLGTMIGNVFNGWGRFLVVGSMLLSVAALIVALIKGPRVNTAIVALAAGFLTLAIGGRWIGFQTSALALPPIHDIQTNWDDPIQFSDALMAAREAQGKTNPVLDAPTIPDFTEERWPGTGGKLVSEIQEQAETKESAKGTVYPKMETLYFDGSPAEVAELAASIINSRGWDIVFTGATGNENGEELQVDATVTSTWFGFKDDVAVRVMPIEGATAVDIRSTSRVGLSDLGANSKRVYGLMIELEDRGNGRRAP